MNTLDIIILSLGITLAVVLTGNKKHLRQIAKDCDMVLEQLKDNGDNHSLPRVVDHWIYFNSKLDLDNFIIEVNKIGFSLLSEQAKEDDIYNYVVNIGRNESVVRKKIIKTVSELEVIAKKHNGYYDGWGCMIQK